MDETIEGEEKEKEQKEEYAHDVDKLLSILKNIDYYVLILLPCCKMVFREPNDWHAKFSFYNDVDNFHFILCNQNLKFRILRVNFFKLSDFMKTNRNNTAIMSIQFKAFKIFASKIFGNLPPRLLFLFPFKGKKKL